MSALPAVFATPLLTPEYREGLLDRLCGRGGAEVTFDLAFVVGEVLCIDDDVALSRLTVATALAEADAATLSELGACAQRGSVGGHGGHPQRGLPCAVPR